MSSDNPYKNPIAGSMSLEPEKIPPTLDQRSALCRLQEAAERKLGSRGIRTLGFHGERGCDFADVLENPEEE